MSFIDKVSHPRSAGGKPKPLAKPTGFIPTPRTLSPNSTPQGESF
ncbi:hypothetical protein DFA_00959 [Cavenderia fasciculata]|uniref:Uncharacterized protein n=1 Tax=Cavenderia fasciculata TaxID=261658 RepID=F4PUR5_CACFS|nr:uncharacterized protein DFA_00959 [Cavenderia fasciculata]EGG21084.1 hypothetical protein DFA_00959 [Cavenderia fasciculata]|eukprot:XP_004358934.1 hypothetical protein DFA_00959 [Cavenderia fasciculata]